MLLAIKAFNVRQRIKILASRFEAVRRAMEFQKKIESDPAFRKFAQKSAPSLDSSRELIRYQDARVALDVSMVKLDTAIRALADNPAKREKYVKYQALSKELKAASDKYRV